MMYFNPFNSNLYNNPYNLDAKLGDWNDLKSSGDSSGFFGKNNSGLICEWDVEDEPIQEVIEPKIPSDAYYYNGHYYKIFSDVTSSWEESQEYCKYLGGNLAVINDAEENTALFNYMKSKGYNSAYFGLSDAAQEGNWKWVDGSPVTYTNWASGEPNSERSNEDYAEFYYKFTDGKWNDGNFKQGTVGDSNIFICEWTPTQPVIETGTNIPDDVFEYNGHSYRVYSMISTTWEGAQEYCVSLGGHLAVINDEKENTELFNYIRSNGYGNVYFGFSDVETEGNWKWVDGSPVTYTNWASGEPSGRRYENYGMFYKDFTNGKWNDGNFTYDVWQQTANFICEWDTVKETDTHTISYEDLSPEELRQLSEDSVNNLKELIQSFEGMNIKLLTFDECDNDPDIFVKSRNWTKFITFMARSIKKEFPTSKVPSGIFSDLDKLNYVVVNAINNVDSETIYSSIMNITDESEYWEVIADKVPTVYAYYSYTIGCALNSIVSKIHSFFQIENIKETITTMLGITINSGLKYLGKGAIDDAIDLLVKLGTQSGVAQANMRAALKFNAQTQKVTAKFGPINLGIALIMGAVVGVDKYNESKSQYSEDQIPSATRDAIIDALAGGIYATIKKFTPLGFLGVDDKLIQVGIWIGCKLSGTEYFDVKDYADNWVDFYARELKLRVFGEYFGTNSGDFIATFEDESLVSGGAGKDYISNNLSNKQIYGGADDDTIRNFSNTERNFVSGGIGNDLIYSQSSNSRMHGDEGEDEIVVLGDFNEVYGGSENDVIVVDSEYNTIHGDADNDEIKVSGKFNKAYGDSGDDLICSNATDNSLYGGLGKDKIYVFSAYNAIYAEEDDDTIVLLPQGSEVVGNTVFGGKGNDYIHLTESEENLIVYGNGDGNDTILGYSESDKINIVGIAVKNVVRINNDRKIELENGSIILKDAIDQKVTLKFDDNSTRVLEATPIWNIEDTTAFYGTRSSTFIVVTGLKKDAPLSGISLNNHAVTISNSVLNQGTVTVSDNYFLELASDVTKSKNTPAGWNVAGTTANYKNASISTGYLVSNNGRTVIYCTASGGDTLVTVSGLKPNAPISGISLNGNVVTLSNSVLNQGTVSVSNGYTLQFSDDVPRTSTTSSGWSISGTTASYKTGATSAGYSVSDDSRIINYTNASGGNTLVTVSGLKSNAPVSGISLNGNVVTLSNSVLNQGTVSVSNGYTLKLADDVAKSSITNANWSVSGTTATYKTNATSAGYSLSSDAKTINYTNASGGNTLVTVTGLKSNAPVSGISLNGNVVTLSNSVLNQGAVSVSNGYTLKLADDVPKSLITNANWSVSGTTATYKANATSAGYSLSSDAKTINYTNASGGNTLVTVSGLKSNAPVSGISLNGNVVTLSNSVLNQGTVSVSNGYTLKLADDVAKSSVTNANWSVSGTTATYKASATSAGYSLSSDGKTINYTNASGGNTLVTVSGLKSNAPVSGISLNGNTVTLSNSVLNQGTVSVSKGYTLKLADDVPKSSITNANWSVSGTTATYKASATSAGYSLSSDGKTINYTNASGGNTLVTVSGLKTNAPVSGISLNGNTVTLSNSVLNQGTVSVSNGYTLKLADDVPKSSITNANWSVSGTTATYKANATSAGYSLSSDAKTINYTNASGGNTLVTVSGLKSNAPVSGISLNGNTVTLSNSVLNQGTVSVSNGYTLKLADDVPKSSITNANWSVSGTTATYKASATSAGYSLSSDGKSITYSNASGGNTLVTISGLKNGVLANNGIIEGIRIENNIVKVSSKITDGEVKITGNGYTLEIVEEIQIPKEFSIKNNVLTVSNKFTGNEINLNEKWASNITKVNVSALSQNVNIIGNGLANSITGGKGADTIDGGEGNDSLTGGAGKDVYIYESGNDVITDYKSGEDKIQMNPNAITSSTLKGSDVILTTDQGTLTIKGVKDKVVTFVDDKGQITEKIFYADMSYSPLVTGLAYDAKKTALTSSNKYTDSTIDLSEYLETVAKVNASALSQDMNITGNGLANSITGGKGADTINGGSGKDTISGGNGDDKLYGGNDNDVLKGDAGNDSLFGGEGNDILTGGAGKDIFVYEGGNDVITDYKSNEDKIQMNPNAITNSTLKGSDVILTTDQGTLTIKGIKDKTVTFVDENGTTTEKIFYANMSYSPLETGLTYDAKRTALTASNKYTNSTIDLSEYLKTIAKVNASALSQDMNITGNNLANSIKSGAGSDIIFGGDLNDTIYVGSGADKIYGDAGNDKLYGDAGNDTLFGGFGNDTLTGGNGSDVFVYEGGNDVITDYAAGDSIKISSGKISKTSYSGKNLVFTIGDSNLTVKNAKGKQITVTDSNGNTTTQIYSGTQTYSKTFELLYDCNFMTDEFQIDDISEVTADDYSIGQIQSISDSDIFDKATLVSDSSFDKK